MKKSKPAQTQMDRLTEGYEKFIKDKEVNKKGKELFNKAIQKAAKPKQRGSK